MQPNMSSVYKMWKSHQDDPEKYPALAEIVDHNGDGVAEVNCPQEIDAIIQSVTEMLRDLGYPMEGKRVVWVMDDRIYHSGTQYRVLDKHAWEASPYANVHKYSHDVYPASAARGARGCTDCHHPNAEFLFANVLEYPFDEQGKPIMQPQYVLLGLSKTEAMMGAWRETYLKPTTYGMVGALIVASMAMIAGMGIRWTFPSPPISRMLRLAPLIIAVLCLGGGVVLWLSRPALMAYMLPNRFWLDSNHFLFAVFVMAAGLLALMWEIRQRRSSDRFTRALIRSTIVIELLTSLVLASLAGALMFFRIPGLDTVTRASYTAFDLAIAFVVVGAIVTVLHRAIKQPGKSCPDG